MLMGMKRRIVFLITLVLAVPIHAETSVSQQIVQGFNLWRSGHAKEAIALLEPLVSTEGTISDRKSRGVAWSVLGSSYLDSERFDEARRAYQHALEIMQPLPEARTEYAAALDNLGIVEQSLDQYSTARSLSKKARHIYEQLGDQAGLAITDTNLAVNAYVQLDYKAAQRAVENASREVAQSSEVREDDLAALDAVKGALALHNHQYDAAMVTLQSAVDRWTRLYGPGYFMLVNVDLLRAQVMAATGDLSHAVVEGKRALDQAESLWGKNSIGYWNAQGSYASVLRLCGVHDQAKRLATEAAQGLADLEQRQCSGCIVNANAFR
jgi:tetratricopeptide (TPR) repeat protein